MSIPPCLTKPRVRRGHRHTITVNGEFVLHDRCLSGLLWWSVARHVMLGNKIQIDKKDVKWEPSDALVYLQQNAHRKWWKDLEL